MVRIDLEEFLWGADASRDNEGGGERGFIKEHKQEPRPLRTDSRHGRDPHSSTGREK